MHADFDTQFSNTVKEKYIKTVSLFTSYSRMDATYFLKPVSSVNVGGLGQFFYHLKSFKGKEQSSGKKFGVYEAAHAIFCFLWD